MMMTRLTVPAERCRDGFGVGGLLVPGVGVQVFDREQTPIRNLAADYDQMVFVSGVGYHPKRTFFRARGRCGLCGCWDLGGV
jgi:hypothetical protein